MSKNLVTIDKEKNLGEASLRMKEKSVRHLLVIDRATGQLLGLITDRDLKKIISPFVGSPRATPQDNATLNIEIGKVMVHKDKMVTAKADEDLKSVVEKMLMKKFGSVPIVDDQGRALGIVTRGDMLKLLVSLL